MRARDQAAAQLRREMEAAFKKNDFRARHGAAWPDRGGGAEDSATWLRLARTVCRSGRRTIDERTLLLERASTAAYIAYQRTVEPAEEARQSCTSRQFLAQRELWRPALDALRMSLDLREAADVRGQYERLREEHGFRVLDYSVDADTASPRACFQFSEDLPGAHRFLAVRGARRHRQAGFVRGREAALRRRIEARRALQRHPARRTAVDRA